MQKTKDWGTRTLLKTGGELGCSGRVSSSCSINDIRRGQHSNHYPIEA
jgi:hypothetical protein